MTAPNTTAANTADDSEPTLVEAFSEFSEALAAEEDAQDAGQAGQPAAPTPGDQAATSPTSTQPGTGAPGAAAPAGTQQPGQAPAQAEAAPALPERQPLTYTINGQSHTFDGGFIIPGHGAIISNDALPRLQDRLQQADRLVAQNQALYAQTQEIQRRGGWEAFDKKMAENAMLDASAALLLRALSDEGTLVALATDPVARQQLLKELHITAREAQFNAANTIRETASKTQTEQQTAYRTQTAIHNAVAAVAEEFEGLTAEDVQAVRNHAQRMHVAIVRPATPAEAREAEVQIGAPIIDVNLLRELLQDRHGLRKAAQESAQRRQTDTLENAARAAAAAPTTVANGNGARPNGTAPRPGAGRAPQAPAQKSLDTMTSAELTRAMKSGRIIDIINSGDEQ